MPLNPASQRFIHPLSRYGEPSGKLIMRTPTVAIPTVIGSLLTLSGVSLVASAKASLATSTTVGIVATAGTVTIGVGVVALVVAGVAFRQIASTVRSDIEKQRAQIDIAAKQAHTLACAQSAAEQRARAQEVPAPVNVMYFSFPNSEACFNWLTNGGVDSAGVNTNALHELPGTLHDVIRIFWAMRLEIDAQTQAPTFHNHFKYFYDAISSQPLLTVDQFLFHYKKLCHDFTIWKSEYKVIFSGPHNQTELRLIQLDQTFFDFIVLRLKCLKPDVPQVSQTAFLSYYANLPGASIVEASGVTIKVSDADDSDEIVPAAPSTTFDANTLAQNIRWQFPSLETMLEWIKKDKLRLNRCFLGNSRPDGLLYPIFYADDDELMPSAKHLLIALAKRTADKAVTTTAQLQRFLDAIVWIAADKNSDKAYELKVAWMVFFADHGCRCDSSKSHWVQKKETESSNKLVLTVTAV